MAVNLSIKEVPDALAERLRERAAAHHRSLQGELMAIIEQAVQSSSLSAAAVPGAAFEPEARERGSKTIEQLMAERKAAGWKPHASLARAPLAVDLVRADRDLR
jgi:plasmid stability protein